MVERAAREPPLQKMGMWVEGGMTLTPTLSHDRRGGKKGRELGDYGGGFGVGLERVAASGWLCETAKCVIHPA